MLSALTLYTGCQNSPNKMDSEFKYIADRFYDLQVLRYPVPGFDELDPNSKKMLYCLQEAALWGREIFMDQNYEHNLQIKRLIEAVIKNYQGDQNNEQYQMFEKYAKRFWFSNGIHHHYSNQKFVPECSFDWFAAQVKNLPAKTLPLLEGETTEKLLEKMQKVMFDPNFDKEQIVLDPKRDIILESCTNLYDRNITQKEVEAFYKQKIIPNDPQPISYGLNSKLIKSENQIREEPYKLGGMYSAAIEKIIYWLNKAKKYTNNNEQKNVIDLLVKFYETGDLKIFDEYSIAWARNTDVDIDFTNGFIEVYSDPMGYRGAWQSLVYFKDHALTQKFSKITELTEWFERNSPIDDKYKRDQVTGMSYRVINSVVGAGDCGPTMPLGVNLPNANWIRAQYGSKSISLGNIETAYDEASKASGMLQEFFTPQQQELLKEHGNFSGKLMTALHEVIGHGSGKLAPNVGTPKETLKNYNSSMEEARADIVALYYIIDPQLVKEGITTTIDVGKAAYDSYIVNGMMRQLVRINLGDQIVQAHMRGRAMIANWCYEHGKAENVIEKRTIDGKTFIVINDYSKLRSLFGQLLKEIQRIKSEGDYEAAKNLIETYGAPVNYELHKEVLERYAKLNIAPYSGFIQPQLAARIENNEIVDISLSIPESFKEQMLYYADYYSILPLKN